MKLDILMHYDVDETTGEIKFIGKEEVTVDTNKASSKKSSKKEEITEPLVTLESNKLTLTKGAIDLLGICEDCRVDIKYKPKGQDTYPVIGSDQAFGVQGGNKLTKSGSISYRGKNRERLSEFGTVFKLEPTETKGVFWLVGDKPVPETISETVDVESELDLTQLDDIDLGGLDFSFND